MRGSIRLIGVAMLLLGTAMPHHEVSASRGDSLRIVIDELPHGSPQDVSLFLCGPFNGWTINDSSTLFRPSAQGKLTAVVDRACREGIFYVSTGTHGLLEGDGGKNLLPPRAFASDTLGLMRIAIREWIDPKRYRLSSTQRHAQPIPMSLPVSRLGIRISATVYIPPSHVGGQKHPVVYALNGESVFNAYDIPGGEWGVDEALDSLNRRRSLAAIVVAVNLPVRVDRTFYRQPASGGGENKRLGELASFIITELHEYITSHYPVRQGRENTFILAGGSRADLGMTLLLNEHKHVGGGIFFLAEGIQPWMVERAKKIAKRRAMQRVVLSAPPGAASPLARALCRAGAFGENELRLVAGASRCEGMRPDEMGRDFGRYVLWLLGRESEPPSEFPQAETPDAGAQRAER